MLRYCRTAPIADVARGYIAASSASRTQGELKTSAKVNANVVEFIEGRLEEYEADSASVSDLIRKVERQCAPGNSSCIAQRGTVNQAPTLSTHAGQSAMTRQTTNPSNELSPAYRFLRRALRP